MIKVSVDPHGIYDRDFFKQELEFSDRTITAEIKQRRLRASTIAGKNYFLGQHIIDWIDRMQDDPTTETASADMGLSTR